MQDKEYFEKYLSGLVGEVFGEELMDKTKPDYYMVNFLRDDELDEDGAVVEEAPKVHLQMTFGSRNTRKDHRYWGAISIGAPANWSIQFLSHTNDKAGHSHLNFS